MFLRKIRQLLSNPFIHFPVWHFDSISSYNINSFSLEDQTMQIIINTAFPVQPTKFFIHSMLLNIWARKFKCSLPKVGRQRICQLWKFEWNRRWIASIAFNELRGHKPFWISLDLSKVPNSLFLENASIDLVGRGPCETILRSLRKFVFWLDHWKLLLSLTFKAPKLNGFHQPQRSRRSSPYSL